MDKYSLCVQWYGKAKGEQLQEIKNNMVNFFIHIVKGKSRDNMWTAFKNTKQALTGKGGLYHLGSERQTSFGKG